MTVGCRDSALRESSATLYSTGLSTRQTASSVLPAIGEGRYERPVVSRAATAFGDPFSYTGPGHVTGPVPQPGY